jgi:surfeit locus 1 family protein
MSGRHRLWFSMLGLLALAASFAALGLWQWQRAQSARAQIEQYAAASEQPPLTSPPDDRPRYRLLDLQGQYEPELQLLLDNRVRGGRAGYEVLTPFRVAGVERRVLVNRGWIKADPDRRVLPDVAVAAAPRTLRGRIDALPRPGIVLSGPPPQTGAPVLVVSYPSAAAAAEYLGRPLFEYQVLLDGAESDGYLREWGVEQLPPARHLAYAGQWLLLSGGAAAVALVMGARSLRERASR